MKKIDFHIHTIATKKDSGFTFSIENLKEYVKSLQLDAIAITNHNYFDYKQYETIFNSLCCKVFPGVEIDVESGHLLLITSPDDAYDFSMKCKEIEYLNNDIESSISFDKLKIVFTDFSKYLLIPHYKKDPVIKDETIRKFGPDIFVGEVSNAKKFTVQLKSEEPIVPVIFSDMRISTEIKTFPLKHTYIQIDEISINSIKYALKDKTKVSLSKNHSFLFQILNDGTVACDGLNVIFGKRSSGKTYTLRKICESFPNTKHIMQFSLVERDEKIAEREFKDKINLKESNISEEYLEVFRSVVNDVIHIDLDSNNQKIEDYLISLKKMANHTYEADVFSKTKVYNETMYLTIKDSELELVIKSVKNLLDSSKYKELIVKHITNKELFNLYLELCTLKDAENYDIYIKDQIDSVIVELKRLLVSKSSAPQIEDCNVSQFYIDELKTNRFIEISKKLRIDRTISSEKMYGFTVNIKSKQIASPKELRDISGNQKGDFSGQFALYNEPFAYLKNLSKKMGIPNSDAYKYFCNIHYKVMNSYGFEVSGGERAEFNLISELNDAFKYDMVLIDEPESSFDNLFLKQSVNQIIKDLANKMPVFVVTHSNTVGASIKPDYILYNERYVNATDNSIEFRIYTGHAGDKKLKSVEGYEIDNFTVLIDSLEAGEEAYKERGKLYENIKN